MIYNQYSDFNAMVKGALGISGGGSASSVLNQQGNWIPNDTTHTGEVTGATILTVDKTAITNKSNVTAATGDKVLIADVSDSDNLKYVTAQSIANLAASGGITRTQITTIGNTIMGSSANTDYTYYVAGAHLMSLPSPNNNQYTVKNNHSANITIDTVGVELIEGVSSIDIAPEESVDIISDLTNWFII